MICMFQMMTRRTDLKTEEFSRYWQDEHVRGISAIPHLRRYVQNHRISIPALKHRENNFPYDGIEEFWLDDEIALRKMRASAEFRLADDDRQKFSDIARSEILVTAPRVRIDGATRPEMIKIAFMSKRATGWTRDGFREYAQGKHADVTMTGQHVRYMQCFVVDAAYEFAEPRFDGLGQAWYATVEDLVASYSAENKFMDDLRRDERKLMEDPTGGYFREHALTLPAA